MRLADVLERAGVWRLADVLKLAEVWKLADFLRLADAWWLAEAMFLWLRRSGTDWRRCTCPTGCWDVS